MANEYDVCPRDASAPDVAARLERVYLSLTSGTASEHVWQLAAELALVRSALERATWRSLVETVVRPHRLTRALFGNAYPGPTATPGDRVRAETAFIDLVYGLDATAASWADAAGLQDVRLMPTACGLRAAAVCIRDELAQLAGRHPAPRVLVLACGYLRELDATLLARFPPAARIVAVDRDGEALAGLRRRVVDPRLQTVLARSVADLDALPRAGRYQLIYRLTPSSTTVADVLPKDMPALLDTDGVLLEVDATPNRPDAAYLETYFDLWLEDRDPLDLPAADRSLPGFVRTFYREPNRALALTRLVRGR